MKAIRAVGVGKQYRIGTRAQYHSLRESITRALTRPFQGTHRVKAIDTFWALRDVGFEINHGETVGLIGRNGAGKSTLLKILSRVTEPTLGEIEIQGRIGSLLEVGTGFHPELTGRENIYLNGAILGMRTAEIRRKFDEIVDFAEITQFLDTPVKHYSSGMYMRLAFAVAAHLEPEILIVDEVLAVGDNAFQRKCLGKMGRVASAGRTVIFVSHHMGAINKLCRQTIWLDSGRVSMVGPTADVVAKYLTESLITNGICEWPEGIANRGTDEFSLLSLRILNHDNIVSSTVDARYPFVLSFEYKIHKALPNCRVGFVLSTADGTVVFDSYDSDNEGNQGRRTPGSYTIRCEVPGDLLLPGHYVLSINAGMPNVKNLLWLENVLSLVVEDTNMIGEVRTETVGIVRPKLKWDRTAR